MKRHFVEFFSPGTFVAERTTKPIEAWDVDAAKRMARAITERYGAKPYAFRFITRERGPDDLDAHVSGTSGLYYLGGKVETIEDVRRRGPSVLLSNMEGNGWNRIISTTKGWQWTQPLTDKDTVLEMEDAD